MSTYRRIVRQSLTISSRLVSSGREIWKDNGEKGEGSSGDAWNLKKVEKGVRATAKSEGFTEKQLADWDALFQFHHQHPTSSSFAAGDQTLVTQDQRQFVLRAPPSWEALWAELAGRFPRPNLARQRGSADSSGLGGGSGSRVGSSAAGGGIGGGGSGHSNVQRNGEDGSAGRCSGSSQGTSAAALPLVNSVTGIGNSKRQRKKAVSSQNTAIAIAAMPPHPSSVERGDLIFAVLDRFEGEFAVGLARVEDAQSSADLELVWCERQDKGFAWKSNPVFKVCMTTSGRQRRVATARTSLQTVLPVPVLLTEASHAAFKPTASLAGQNLRLQKACVQMLRDYCVARNPSLIQSDDGAEESSDESGSPSEDDEDEGSHSGEGDSSSGSGGSSGGDNGSSLSSDDDDESCRRQHQKRPAPAKGTPKKGGRKTAVRL